MKHILIAAIILLNSSCSNDDENSSNNTLWTDSKKGQSIGVGKQTYYKIKRMILMNKKTQS